MAGDLGRYLVQDLEQLHDDGDFTDLEFVAGGVKPERIRAHRLIVLCRCRRYRSKKRQWLTTGGASPVTVKLEHTDPETARRVVRYLYTGQIDTGEPESEGLIQNIVAALEMGLPELKSHCLERLASGVTADSVCSTLISGRATLGSITMEEEKDGGGAEGERSAVREVEQCCMNYIEANTRAVFKTKGFLLLPKETLLSIIQSSKLTASEEDVWRGVLSWGQAKAGVKNNVKMWTDDDRSKMKQVLNGVLEHVRLMEIGSEVFAQEVEPTGLLSMEMTLARYRHAAVHGKGHLSPVKKQSRPRSGCTGTFVGSELIAERTDFQMQINEWCGTPSQEWVLLYRASRDGFEAKKFHAACDEKGATLVLVKTPSGCLFGGYTDASWSSRFKRGKFASSSSSFLFSLINTSGTEPTKFDIRQPAYAINNHPGNGPIFGSGADLCISSECHRNKDSYSQLPYTYSTPDTPNNLLTGEQYFSVEDYEVFGLSR